MTDWHSDTARTTKLAPVSVFIETCIRENPDPRAVEAKMQLLDACYDHINVGTPADPDRYLLGCLRSIHTFRALACEYSDHPGYRPEWSEWLTEAVTRR